MELISAQKRTKAMKKLSFSSLFAQLLLLIFVIVWIAPTFGLLISSLRDKDVLVVSGWWTSFVTTEVNEIHRTLGMDSQYEENGSFYIEDNLFGEDKPKKISSFGITSKDINAYTVGDIAIFKDLSEITVDEDGNYSWKSENKFTKKKGKRIFITATSPPSFTCLLYTLTLPTKA